ncbi:MAG: hypothetical protein VX574_12695 [Myxococcota bacterium]|nr:hypothetical protein [Myxococcota bacterium]
MQSLLAVGGVVLLTLVLVACAPRQQVPLTVDPPEAELYLDGELVEEPPEFLNLRSDRHHKIFVKSPGHRAELVVLRSVQRPEEAPALDPDSVYVRLEPLDPTGRELVIEEAGSP